MYRRRLRKSFILLPNPRRNVSRKANTVLVACPILNCSFSFANLWLFAVSQKAIWRLSFQSVPTLTYWHELNGKPKNSEKAVCPATPPSPLTAAHIIAKTKRRPSSGNFTSLDCKCRDKCTSYMNVLMRDRLALLHVLIGVSVSRSSFESRSSGRPPCTRARRSTPAW